MSNIVWTDEKSAAAEKLWKALPQIGAQEIADKLGVSYQSVHAHAHRNRDRFPKREHPFAIAKRERELAAGIKLKPKPKPKSKSPAIPRYQNKDEIAKVADLMARGLGAYEVSSKIGIARSTIYKMKKFDPLAFAKTVPIKPKLIGPFKSKQGRVARRGEGVHLKNCLGWLHMGGESLTTDKAYIWRGTASQAANMIAQSNFELTAVAE